MIVQLLLLFIIIEIAQTWFILFEKRISKGVWGIILTEIKLYKKYFLNYKTIKDLIQILSIKI